MADAVETAAEKVLSPLLEIPLIRANQPGAQRPALPYATYQLTTRNVVGRDEQGRVSAAGLLDMHAVREGILMVNVFGEDARQVCDNLILSIRKPTSRYLMKHENFVITGNEEVNDLTSLRDDNRFEPMANLDLSFRYTGKYQDDVGLIETVDGDGDIGGIETHLTINLSQP